MKELVREEWGYDQDAVLDSLLKLNRERTREPRLVGGELHIGMVKKLSLSINKEEKHVEP